MKPFYRPAIAEALHISRTHLFLWPLALGASLVGIFGTFQIFFDTAQGGQSFSLATWYTDGDFISGIFLGWSQSFSQIPWGSLRFADVPLVIFFFLLLFIVLAIAIIITSSEGGLMYALAQLQEKKKTTYLVSFRQGLDKFWQLFTINLFYRLLYLSIVALIIMPLLYQLAYSKGGSQLPFAALVYFILIPLIVIIDLITRYSLLYIMLYKQTMRQAFSNAWLLFRTNWIISIETSLVILAILFVSFAILAIIFLPILMLFVALFATFIAAGVALELFLLTAIVLLVVIVAVFISFFTAFQMSVWVSVFRRLTTGEHQSKIHRLTSHLPWLHRRLT
ncbi:MAG: hypothetical protein HY422_01760 [Candidatus Komeilibacteria bacterium]|nr:hypothetical protein [Candidatus Komeilibacteria bacterium]